MRYLFTFFIVVAFSAAGKSCGWWPESDLYFFYNLFDQTNISSKSYYPFLRDDYNKFYQQDTLSDTSSGNILLWEELLPEWSEDGINLALTSETDTEFEKIWSTHRTPNAQNIKAYILFARQCSDLFAYRNVDSWDYDEILRNKIIDVTDILAEGMRGFKSETSTQLRMRYGYQIVRILHYSKQYKEAVEFFTHHILDRFEKNEIYYYTLDQVAGCHYSLENYEQAAYYYVQVFNQSMDRKKSAFLSYSFCTNKDAEGKSLFKTKEDSVSFIVLKSLRAFSDDLDGIQQLMSLAPADAKTELLFMRAVNNIERTVWPTQIGMTSKTLPNYEDGVLQRIQDLDQLAAAAFANPQIKNKDFWQLSRSYLAFLQNDLPQAKQKLAAVNGKNFSSQKTILSRLYEVFSWSVISATEEKYLSPILNDIITEQPLNTWDPPTPAWKYLILDRVAHMYYVNDQLAKAFLIHNRVESLNTISSLPLLDDLLDFIRRPKKNEFENMLLRRTSGIPDSYNALDYVLFLKGLYYLQEGQPSLAHPLLAMSSVNNTTSAEVSLLGQEVSAKIFSNNITECFSCPDTIMEDSVYLASVFSFIRPTFSKAELASYLITLDSMTNDVVQWKSKLANYLLANYYFNVANTGYYRGTLNGLTNCCHYNYFFSSYSEHQDASALIDRREGYNLFGIEYNGRMDNGLAKKAFTYYQNVINKSLDPELNARCLYMMAKCELNTLYNTSGAYDFDGYDGTVDNDTRPYKTSFQKLKKDYKKTAFYKMIIKECSFFRYYCS